MTRREEWEEVEQGEGCMLPVGLALHELMFRVFSAIELVNAPRQQWEEGGEGAGEG